MDGIGAVYEDYIVSDLVYTVPRHTEFFGAPQAENALMFTYYKCKNMSAGDIKLSVANASDSTAVTYVYDLFAAKVGKCALK